VDGDQNNNNAFASGAAYIFVHSGGAWVQQAYLNRNDAVEQKATKKTKFGGRTNLGSFDEGQRSLVSDSQ
jgi:hypothetical protein